MIPDQPGNFRTLGVTEDSVTLAWDPPSGSNDITSYELYYEHDHARLARVRNYYALFD